MLLRQAEPTILIHMPDTLRTLRLLLNLITTDDRRRRLTIMDTRLARLRHRVPRSMYGMDIRLHQDKVPTLHRSCIRNKDWHHEVAWDPSRRLRHTPA